MKGLSRKVSSCGRPERPDSHFSSQFRRDPLDQWTADDGSRWRGPAETMALMPLCRLGPPPRSLAADAHACIMGMGLAAHRIQGCGTSLLVPRQRAPLDAVIPTTSSPDRTRSCQERGTTRRAVDPTQPACRRARRCKGRAFGGRCAASLDIVCARRRRQIRGRGERKPAARSNKRKAG